METPTLAIVVPCYNEEEILYRTSSKLTDVLNRLIEKNLVSKESYISLIDDGSKDGGYKIMETLSKENGQIKVIKFSKNFGHQAAILAGLLENEADIFVTIDADLQDDIETIEEMVKKYNDGCETVYGVRSDRSTDGPIKRLLAESYYKINTLLGAGGIPNHADFRLVSKKITALLRENPQANLYLRGQIPEFGYKSDIVRYKRAKRIGGVPKYSVLASFNLAMDGITAFSTKPLRLISITGFLIFCCAILGLLYAAFDFALHGIFHKTAFLSSVIAAFCGVQLLSLGIVSEYLGKIYRQVQQKPRYIIEERLN